MIKFKVGDVVKFDSKKYYIQNNRISRDHWAYSVLDGVFKITEIHGHQSDIYLEDAKGFVYHKEWLTLVNQKTAQGNQIKDGL